nr:hypothetical protein [Tanacetum cinerariifolium]
MLTRRTLYSLKDMDLESAQNNAVAKFPLLKPSDYEMLKLRIEQYFQVQDYALWDVIENGNSIKPVPRTTANADGTSTSTILGPITTKEKAQKKNDVKARIMLLMALLNEHLLTFSQYKDAKTLFEAIQARFGGNDATKKTLLKQIYENFNSPSTENKADLDTMSIDDLYNNFKIIKQEVKRTVTTSSISGSQNMDFLLSPGSTNEVDTVSTPVSTVSTHDNTANLSNAIVYAFMANQPNGSQLVHEDLEQIYEEDLEEMDLKWQLAWLSVRARRECKSPRNQESRPRNQDSSRKTVNVEDTSSKAMLAIDGPVFDWSYMADDEAPTNMALMAFLDSKGNRVTSVVGKQGINAIKSSSCWVWRHKIKGDPQDALKDQGCFDSGCSRHITGNISYITDFKEHDRGVLFTDTECFVLSPNFKLADESHVLLKVLRKNNMYSFDMKNIVPQKDLTCLLAKAINDESMLWHKRLGIKREYSVAGTPQQNEVTKRRNMTLIEAARTMLADSKLPTTFWAKALGKFDGKSNEEIFVGYSTISKAFRVYNTRTRKVEENLHITFLENKPMITGGGPEWLFDIDALSESMNYAPVSAGTHSNDFAAPYLTLLHKILMVTIKHGPFQESECDNQERTNTESSTKHVNTVGPSINTANANDNIGSLNINIVSPPVNIATPTYADYPSDPLFLNLEDTGIFDDAYDDRDEGAEANYNNLESNLKAMQEELLQSKLLNVWTLVDLPHGKRAIGTKWVCRNKKDHRGIVIRNKSRLVAQGHRQEEGIYYDEVFAHIARIEAIRLRSEQMAYFSVRKNIVCDILKKFGFSSVKSASTPMETHKPLSKDIAGTDVDVHLYSDYAGASLDRKSTTGGCQFLSSRLISWQCKKQTIATDSTTEAEYIAASNYRG